MEKKAEISMKYFVIRQCNCGTFDLKTGKASTDIIGITTDEDYAKSRQSVFCYYEETKMIQPKKEEL